MFSWFGKYLDINNYQIIGASIMVFSFILILVLIRLENRSFKKEIQWIIENGQARTINFAYCQLRTTKVEEELYHTILTSMNIEGENYDIESDSISCSRARLLKAMKGQVQTQVYYHENWGVHMDVSKLQEACNWKDASLRTRIWMKISGR